MTTIFTIGFVAMSAVALTAIGYGFKLAKELEGLKKEKSDFYANAKATLAQGVATWEN